MKWEKLGVVYTPDGTQDWARSRAMIPIPTRLNREVIRVFITCCDEAGIGRPGYVDLNAANPLQVLAASQQPILDIGRPGTFDENGVLACSVIDDGQGRLLMYYAGFELGTKIRYRLLTGLAISTDGGVNFRRFSKAPILDRSDAELHFRGGPYCIREADRFRLWYVGGSEWIDVDGKSMPVYDIRYSESKDGFTWPDEGRVVVSITGPDEHGFGRPAVIRDREGGYRMFYSVRRISYRAYRLGYAESDDGLVWRRMDDALNLDVSPSGFDSEAIMYAAPIEVDGRLYLFYNGNEFGKDGFAVAVQADV